MPDTDKPLHQGTGARRDAILAQQRLDWSRKVDLAREGNPFATLCMHCYGRHAPPRDDICPHPEPPR